VLLLHLSATIMAVLSEVHYKDGYIDVMQKMVNQCTDVKYYFKTTWFKIHIEI